MLDKYFNKEEISILKKSNDIEFKSTVLVAKLTEKKVTQSGKSYFIELIKEAIKYENKYERCAILLQNILENLDEEDLKELSIPNEVIEIIKINYQEPKQQLKKIKKRGDKND